MNTRLWVAIASALVLTACSSGVVRQPTTAPSSERVSLSANKQVASVSLTMTHEAKKKAADNLLFNPEELLIHVRWALIENSLLNASPDQKRPNLDVEVKNMRVRSNFSATMWGFMAGTDSIKADIVIRDQDGKELDRFEVSVSYAFGGLAGGDERVRMGWLYRSFAAETVKELSKQ